MNRLLTVAVAAAALWSAACGGGTAITPPPPMGKFTNGSLNGTYAFMTSGETFVNTSTGPTEVSMVRVGSFVADGNGHITGGVEDVNASGTVSTAATITGGSYTINNDGRGTIALNVASTFNSTINFSIVLTSGSSGPPSVASGGLMIDETNSTNQASTGSGNFLQQNTTAFVTTTITGNYVFDFSGLDSSGSPASIVGELSTASGSLTGGIDDGNDSGNLTTTATILSSSFISDSQNPATLSSAGRGLVSINGETFAFYIVDSTRVRFISVAVSGGATPDMLTGDAVSQASVPPAPSGSFAFLVAGSDLNASNGLIRVGRFTVSGSTVSKILLDENDATNENEFKTFTSSTPTLNYNATTGRGTVSFSATSLKVYSFVFYLSSSASGVIQDVSPSDTSPAIQVADGTIAAQTAGPFSGSNITGTYAINWSGLVTANGSIQSTDEEDFLSQVTVSNLSLSGTGDIFQFTGLSLNTNFGVGGSMNFNGGDGTGDDGNAVDMTVIIGQPHVDMVVYIVNPQLAFFANRDNTGTQRIVAGVMQAQQ